MFTYDGTGWIRDYWNNTTYTNASLGQGYVTCSTAAATVAKIGELSSYSLTTGGIVSVKFTNAVPANATLNINDKGAKAIYYRGSAITADIIKAGDIATFIYSSRYHLISIDRWQKDIESKQAVITGAATTVTNSNLTASRVLTSDASGKIAASNITSTELGYLDGVTSNIQTQLNGKMAAQPRSIEFSASADGSVNEGFIDWHFNGSSADYTSRIIENASGSLQINGMTVKNGEVTATTFKGSLSGTATNATKDGDGNTISSTYATNSDHKIKHYTSLSQIRLTEGSETLETICANLPNNSILRCNIGESSNQTIYPASGYGTLIVNKVNGTRCYLEFHGHTSNAHYYATVYNGAIDENWERIPRKADVDGKQATITGAATTVTTSDLTVSRALVSNASGKIAVSAITSTELGYLNDVKSNIQDQLDGKQATITGAATTIVSSNLTGNRALLSNASGKIAVSAVTNTELGYLSGVTSAIQTQLNGKQATITGAATTITSSNLTASRALISNSSGKIAVSAVTSTELGYLDGVTSAIQTQLDDKLPLGGGTLTGTLKTKAIIAESTLFLRNTISKGTTPTSSTGRYISFVDKDGTDVKNRLGMIYGYVSKSGADVLGLYSYKPEADTSTQISLSIYYPKTGDTYAEFTGNYFKVNRMVASCLLLTNAGGEIGYGSEDPSGNVPAVQGRVYFRTI